MCTSKDTNSKTENQKSLLQTLSKAGAIIAETTDLHSALNLTLKLILDTLLVENASIMLLSSDKKFLKIVASRGLDPKAARIQVPLGQGIAGKAALQEKTILIENIDSFKEFTEKKDTEYTTKSALCVPMKIKNRLIGVINVNNKKSKNIFDSNDQLLLEALAPQIGGILENAKLLNEQDQKVRELGALFDIARAGEEMVSTEKFLEESVQIITMAVLVETCSIMMIDEKENCLVIKNYTGDYLDQFRNKKIPLGEGIAGKVGATGEPLLINDFSTDRAINKNDIDNETITALSVPMKIRGKVVGVVNVSNKHENLNFTNQDLKLLLTLAGQMASSIEKVKLYSSMEQKIKELSTVNSVAARINSSIDLKKVLDLIIDLLVETLSADSGSLMLYSDKDKKLEIEVSRGFAEKKYLTSFEIGEGVAGWCARHRRPVLIENSSESDLYAPNPEQKDISLICSPMVVKDKVLGVICLEKNLEIQDCFEKSDLELLVTLANSAAIAIDNANLYKDLLNIYFETIQSLAAAIEAKDAYTHGHSRRVTDFAMATAKKMGCDEITLKTIWHSALLHDIGKIGINESILLKPGKLTNDEFAHIQSHPILGSKILESIDFLANVRAQLKYHHERWDGKGYPDKLKGTAIPFGARIIAVADTFDAMTSTRPYRKALSLAEAKNEIIRCSGSQFDPSVVEAFLKIPEKELQQIIDFKNIQSANEKPVIYETFEKAGVS